MSLLLPLDFNLTGNAPSYYYDGALSTFDVDADVDLEPTIQDYPRPWTLIKSDFNIPIIDSQFPTGIDVPLDTLISFSTKDTGGMGIDLSTLDVTVGGVQAIAGGVFQSGWDGPSSAAVGNGYDGYDVVVDPTSDLDAFDSLEVVVSVKDNGGARVILNWSFTTEDVLGVLVTPIDPTNGEIDVPFGSNIEVQLSDEDVVLEDWIKVEVDTGSGFQDAFVFSDTPKFKSGWDGPGSTWDNTGGVYTITIDRTSNFPSGATVQVRVTASDPTGNSTRL